MRKYALPFVVLLLLVANLAESQGTFRNLDFEEAILAPNQTGGEISSADALPGWAVYFGSEQKTQIVYNIASSASTAVSLLGSNANPIQYGSVEGQFCVLLQGGVTASDASIMQTALIPAASQSLRFKVRILPYPLPPSLPLLVYLGEQNIPFFALSTGPNYTLYGGDISAFANQSLQLRFSALSSPDAAAFSYNGWNLDSIMFSSEPIPEPGTLNLFVFGLLLLGSRLLARKTRSTTNCPRKT